MQAMALKPLGLQLANYRSDSDGFDDANYRRRRGNTTHSMHPETPQVPVIVFSADCHGERGEKARAPGCNECIQKRATFTAIRAVLDRYLY